MSADHGHSHGHSHAGDGGHGHAHARSLADPPDRVEADPANQSLNDALRLSFIALKLIMVGVLLLFCFSGWFKVNTGEVAVVLRLGEVVGLPGQDVYKPGAHFALPEPIDEVVVLPVTDQQCLLNKEFWFDVQKTDEGKTLDQMPVRALEVGRDGTLVTSDQNLMHLKATVIYCIDEEQAVAFVRNIQGTQKVKPVEAADTLVRRAAERALVRLAATTSAQKLLSEKPDSDRVTRLVQENLNAMTPGLKVRQVLITQLTPPLAVRAEFDAVASAESERASAISGAQKEETEIMTGAAGQGYPQLLELIQAYEKARRLNDGAAAADLDKRIQTLLESEAIGGKARKLLGEAEAYKREVVQRVAAEAAQFKTLLSQNQQNPRIFRDRKLQDVRQEVLAASKETFYVPQGLSEFILLLGTDPDLQRKREDARYKGVK